MTEKNNWIQRDLNVLWHPFTQMKDCKDVPPIMIEKAQGLKLFDDKGNFYYDTISSWWCNIHGHNHPTIMAAIKKQLDELDHVLLAGFTHRPAIEVAEKIVSITPENLTKVFYSDNGSTAVETAMKISLQYWKNSGYSEKTKFVSLDRGYHGDTIGAMSVGGESVFNKAFTPVLFKAFKAPSPYCYRCPIGKEKDCCDFECIEPLEKIFKEHQSEIAALVMEPLLMAAGGMIIYPAAYLQKASQLAKQYNIHLILDEVATGFGRTGKMFSCEHADTQPDFLCISKGLTSGVLPFAATLTTDSIFNAFYDDYENYKTLYHGHTYTGNPIGCAAALASMKIFEEEQTLETIEPLIEKLHERTQDFLAFDFVGDVRCLGMVAAIEFVTDKKSKEIPAETRTIGMQIFREGLKRNIILRPLGNVTYLYLPLCTTQTQLNTILNRVYDILRSME